MIEPGFVETELQGHNTHPMVLEAIENMRKEIGKPLEAGRHRASDPLRGRRAGPRGRERGAGAPDRPASLDGRSHDHLERVRAVTFQEPGRVALEERPEPEPLAADDAVVRVEATGICGSDLHIYHGRVKIEPGFTIGHEFVGTVIAAGDAVTRVAVGDRVLGCFHTACGVCFFCMRGAYQKCDEARVFGHGATLGSLQGAQAEQVLVPRRQPRRCGACPRACPTTRRCSPAT